jgi:hypothetical protein
MDTLLFEQSEPPPALPDPYYTVRFVNGDELSGKLVHLDSQQVQLETWYAGTLRFARTGLRSIRVTQRAGVIYAGPTSLDGWVVSDSKDPATKDSWEYRSGVFYSKEAGGIARNLDLEDMTSVDLDVGWRGFLQLTVTLYTKSLKVYKLARGLQVQINGAAPAAVEDPEPQEGAGFYALQFNRNAVYLLTVRPDGQTINSPVDMIAGLENKNLAHFSIRVNKEQKTISLLVDGQFVKTWKETEEFAGQGKAVRFVQQGQAPLNLKNIRVNRWDGRIETPVAPATPTDADLVYLRNQDTLSGKLEKIENGAVSFTTSFGTLPIPAERVDRIELPIPENRDAGLEPGSVHVELAHGGAITFRLEQWAQDKVIAVSPSFGRAEFDPSAFARMDFRAKK